MKSLKKIIAITLSISIAISMMTSCGKKEDNGVYNSSNAPTSSSKAETETSKVTESQTEVTTTTADTKEISDPKPLPDSSESKKEEITAPYIVNEAKNYMIKKGVLETDTHVEWKNIRYAKNEGDTNYETLTVADLSSGFNDKFYYIKEASEEETQSGKQKNPGYEFYIDNDLGYIKYRGNEYKILNRIFINECNLRDLSAETMSNRFIKDLIIDMDELVWDESKDGKYYLVEQRIPYSALSINKANSCSFRAFDSDMLVRQVLKFDKKTFRLESADVICQYLDVSRNEENQMTIHSSFKYEKTHEYDSSIAKNVTELDSFKGYSIY